MGLGLGSRVASSPLRVAQGSRMSRMKTSTQNSKASGPSSSRYSCTVALAKTNLLRSRGRGPGPGPGTGTS